MPDVPIYLRTETQKTVYQAMKTYEGSLIQAYMAAMTKFSSMTIQGTFVLNGSVGIAAFASSNIENAYPVFLCSIGAVCALLASFFALLAQKRVFELAMMIHYDEEILALGENKAFVETISHLYENKSKQFWYKNHYVYLCVLCIVFSICFFCIGLYQTMQIYQIELSA